MSSSSSLGYTVCDRGHGRRDLSPELSSASYRVGEVSQRRYCKLQKKRFGSSLSQD
jgi:hypothetical protein